MADNSDMDTTTIVEDVTLAVGDGTSMPAYVARPTSDGPHPGILVYQEAFGVNHHMRDVTERFAQAGYVAISPALFHRTDAEFEGSYTDFGPVMQHMQALTTEGLEADARAAYDWLTADDGGAVSEVVSIGYCLGGRVSFLTDLILPVKASVSYYGGGIAPNPARGQAGLLERVEELKAPILLVWGGKDAHLGPDQTRAIDDALKAAGKEYTSITFAKADHGFFCDERASFEPDSSSQAWALTLAFFDTYLTEKAE